MNLDIQLSPHFVLREFLHPGAEKELTADIIENLRHLAQKLEEARSQLGNRPVHINSGFRTAAHNRAVGGVKNSQHLYGHAADIVVRGLAPNVVQGVLADWPGGMGLYTTFTHLDVGTKRRWSGS